MSHAMKSPEQRHPDMSHDWRQIPLPANIDCSENCFLQSAQIFGQFHSTRSPGLTMGTGSGIYSQSQLVVGERGAIRLGDYACINSATLQCESEITIGAHCLIAWGVVIADCVPDPASWSGRWFSKPRHRGRPTIPAPADARPVVLCDNVWVGFGSVIMPGVTIGEGAIIGCRTVIATDVPPYTLVAGSPSRMIRALERDESRKLHSSDCIA